MASFNTGATEVPLWIDSKAAAGTVTEGAVLKYFSSGDFDLVTPATTFTDAPMGIARHACASGDRVSVLRAGRAVVAATPGATITNGLPAMVTSGGTGQVETWAFKASGLGTYAIGQIDGSTRTANSSGEVIAVAVNFYRIQP